MTLIDAQLARCHCEAQSAKAISGEKDRDNLCVHTTRIAGKSAAGDTLLMLKVPGNVIKRAVPDTRAQHCLNDFFVASCLRGL